MRFWDASALVPMVLAEPSTEQVRRLQAEDSDVYVWWATRIECLSPLLRRIRERSLTAAEAHAARQALDTMFANFSEIAPSEEVRDAASRVIARHSLRAADALQLGAALDWVDHRPFGHEFVCLDARLREAALREGFSVLP